MVPVCPLPTSPWGCQHEGTEEGPWNGPGAPSQNSAGITSMDMILCVLTAACPVELLSEPLECHPGPKGSNYMGPMHGGKDVLPRGAWNQRTCLGTFLSSAGRGCITLNQTGPLGTIGLHGRISAEYDLPGLCPCQRVCRISRLEFPSLYYWEPQLLWPELVLWLPQVSLLV